MSRMHWWIMAVVSPCAAVRYFLPAGTGCGRETLADARWQSGIVRPGHGAPFYSAYRDSGDGGDDKKRGKPCAGEYDGGGLRMQRQGGAAEPGVERTALRGV